MLEKFPGRSIFQPTKSLKRGARVEKKIEPYYVQSFDEKERRNKRVLPSRPSSAPITNLKRAQRIERNRLSTPSGFSRYGDQYLDKSMDEMRRIFPGKTIFKMVKVLPGENFKNEEFADMDILALGKDDSNLFEWVIENDPKRDSINYDPDGELVLNSGIYVPKILEPGKYDLPADDRADYVFEKMCQLSIPKTKWGSSTVKRYARDDDDHLISVEVNRTGNDYEDGDIHQFQEEKANIEMKLKHKFENKAVKHMSKYAIENTDGFKSFGMGWQKKRIKKGLTNMGLTATGKQLDARGSVGIGRRTGVLRVYKKEKTYLKGSS